MRGLGSLSSYPKVAKLIFDTGFVSRAMNNMELNELLVSVVMSCYNAERWLAESIESVLVQTWRDFEFIIVDDGSQDGTLRILKEFAERDERILLVVKENTGLTDSLNIGISKACGKWIARIDADDLCSPNRLERQLSYANTDSRLVFIGAGLIEINEHGDDGKAYFYPEKHSHLFNNLITSKRFVPHSSAFFRADAFRQVGGYRPRIRRSQDHDLWLRLSKVGRFACLPEPLVKIRKHASQISHDESGIRQRVDSTVSMVSYWLRQWGHADPVAGEQEQFVEFYTWVESQVIDSDLHEMTLMQSKIKQLLTNGDVAAWTGIAGSVLRHPNYALRLIKARLFGLSLGAQLAKVWAHKA